MSADAGTADHNSLRSQHAQQLLQKRVDEYFVSRLVPQDAALIDALADSGAAGLPAHNVAPNQGKLLQIFAEMCGARRVLEIGTLGGYSTIWLARAVEANGGGRVVSLEIDAQRAEVARRNIARAKLPPSVTVDIVVGRAADTLAKLAGGTGADGDTAAAAAPPFDLIFIDADKPNNPVYLELSLKLSRHGTVIIGDNVVRDGAVADEHSTDANVQGVRRFIDMMASDPRLSATAV